MLNRQAGIRNQIRQGTFTRVAPPTIVEMEDLGSEDGVQPPPPGEENVDLPPPPASMDLQTGAK